MRWGPSVWRRLSTERLLRRVPGFTGRDHFWCLSQLGMAFAIRYKAVMDRIIFMKSVNFEFLRPENDLLANLGGLAEAILHIDPGSALTRLRSFAEELTKAIYKEELLPRMPQSSFYELIKSPVFEDCVSKSLIHQINFLRIQGNDTAHGAEGELRNAQMALRSEEHTSELQSRGQLVCRLLLEKKK